MPSPLSRYNEPFFESIKPCISNLQPYQGVHAPQPCLLFPSSSPSSVTHSTHFLGLACLAALSTRSVSYLSLIFWDNKIRHLIFPPRISPDDTWHIVIAIAIRVTRRQQRRNYTVLIRHRSNIGCNLYGKITLAFPTISRAASISSHSTTRNKHRSKL